MSRVHYNEKSSDSSYLTWYAVIFTTIPHSTSQQHRRVITHFLTDCFDSFTRISK